MKQYTDMLRKVLLDGTYKEDRTGTGTYSLFGEQLRFDLSKGFPATTTKKLFFRGVVTELIFFLKGETNVSFLHEHGVRIWDQWAEPDGNLGKIYGYQWRNWNSEGRDQLSNVIELIKKDPSSRRLIVNAWNVSQLDEMALPPCHVMFQFYVANGKLSCQLYQRSGDAFLGIPFNIASYSLLTHMVAKECGLEVGEFIHTIGDIHIYLNHIEQVKEQLSRAPKKSPQLWLNPDKTKVDDFEVEDVKLLNYECWPRISAPIAV